MGVRMLAAPKTMKGLLATAISVWFGVITCIMGCSQMGPESQKSAIFAAPAVASASAENASDLMPDMADCHHSSGNSSAPSHENKSGAHRSLSCCPLEATVAAKTSFAPPRTTISDEILISAQARVFSDGSLGAAIHVPLFRRTGRDTLLKTRLLRL
jgi:hypothetical protein